MKLLGKWHINKKIVLSAIVLFISGALTLSILSFEHAFAPLKPIDASKNTQNKPPAAQKPTVKPSFDKQKYSTTDSASLWVIVNKSHPLSPLGYTPNDLVQSNGATISNSAVSDFNAMLSAGRSVGMKLTIVSSYRSYATQLYTYNNYVKSYGQAMTDTFSARAGYSEHQTGLAIDFGSGDTVGCNLEDCFGTTKEGAWLKANSWKYGFIIRYTVDKQSITGYKSEPWHLRYVGRDLAAEMQKENTTTLEEFFKVSGGIVYKP